MKFLKSIFSRKIVEKQASSASSPAPESATSETAPTATAPATIRVYDSYGREVEINREDWRDKVLLDNLNDRRDNPQALYDMLVMALQDGFTAEVLPYAEHLARIDTIPSRGATLLGVAYMECNRLNEAADVLCRYLAHHGDDGVVLTNLAKVQHRQSNPDQAAQTLWRGLLADPNQDNGLRWYLSIEKERNGEAGELEACRKVASIPGSWRARTLLAHNALGRKQLSEALAHYEDALAVAGSPIPTDLLMHISGDLGNHGHLAEIIRLVVPRFDVDQHGVLVGNNLIKAYCDLGLVDEAREILHELYSRRRPDWQKTLRFWDGELEKASLNRRQIPDPEKLSVMMLMLPAPLWARDQSPFATLLPTKEEDAPEVCFFGSVIIKEQIAEDGRAQLADGPGRLSRVVPLILAEHLQIYSNARATTIIPWVQTQGFAVFPSRHSDEALVRLGDGSNRSLSYAAGITVEVVDSNWDLTVRVLRLADEVCIGEWQRRISGDPGEAVIGLINDVLICLGNEAPIQLQDAPEWYRPLAGTAFSNQLLRLEQQLAVYMNGQEDIEGSGLSGQREILEGILHLCVEHPGNALSRIMLGQTLRLMGKSNPDVVAEFAPKVARLEQSNKLDSKAGALVAEVIRGEILPYLGH